MSALAPVIDQIAYYREHWPAFVLDTWPGVRLEPFQHEALEALSEPGGKVSIRSGHGPGKTALGAWSVIIFQATHFPAKAPCSAPTGHQLDDVLRPEIQMWLNRAPHLKREFRITQEKCMLVAEPDENFAAFRTGSKHNPDALQGFHADHLLFVLDEASGIDDSVFEVAEGALSTPGARVLMMGNPTRRTGYFFRSHHSDRAHWHTMHVPCSASSRVDPAYIERMKRWGEDSNVYRVRVLGEFPKSDDDATIPLEIIEAAVDRDVEQIRGAPRIWGVDVARFGSDFNAVECREGNVRHEPPVGEPWGGIDTMRTTGKIKAAYDATDHKPDQILVDVIGLGAGVCDRLTELGLPVRGINVAEAAAASDQYARLRDELWFLGREWFEARDCRMERDDELIAELSTVPFHMLSSGKKQVASKDELKRAGLPSPNRADAFLLTFAGGSRKRAPRWGGNYKPANWVRRH